MTGRCLRLQQGRSRVRLLLGRVCSISYRQSSLVAALRSSKRAGRHALAPARPFAALPAALRAIPALPALPATLRTPRAPPLCFLGRLLLM